MDNELKKLIAICVIRYLNGDIDEFVRLRNKAIDIYTGGGKCTINGGPMMVTVRDILQAKGVAV
jgi:hypothetical protein